MPFLIFSVPYLVLYRVLIEWILGVELPWNTQIGANFTLYHGQALVVNDNTIIGTDCTLRNSTTIGHKILPDGSFSKSPKIGDNVDIGANTVIIGSITIGNNVDVAAGARAPEMDHPTRTIAVGMASQEQHLPLHVGLLVLWNLVYQLPLVAVLLS